MPQQHGGCQVEIKLMKKPQLVVVYAAQLPEYNVGFLGLWTDKVNVYTYRYVSCQHFYKRVKSHSDNM